MKKLRLPGPYEIKPAIPHLFELPIPFDVLIGATEECLHGYAGKDWVNFEKIHETPGSTTYQLSHYELVNLGKLTIRKLRNDLSEVYFSGPPSAASQRRKPTQEERAEIESAPNKDEMVKSILAVNKKIKKDSNDLYKRRKDHLGDVITAYLDRLSRENFRPEEQFNIGGTPENKEEKEKVLITDIFDIDQDLDITGGKYGTYRDLTFDDVMDIVNRCRNFQARGGKVPEFHRKLELDPAGSGYFELETLRKYLRNPKFAPKDT
jgi:hypothetical protein